MYTFTSKFGSSELKQRIGMMNRRGSGPSVWARYVLWGGMLGLMGLACRHKQTPDDEHIAFRRGQPKISPTNATRTLAAKLDAQPSVWFRAAAMIEELPRSVVINGQKTTSFMFNGYPTMLSVSDGKLRLFTVEDSQVQVFINGQASTVKTLENTPFAQVNDLFIYQKEATARGRNPDEQYQVLVGTTHKTTYSPIKEQWALHLKANAVSGSIYGESHTFSMNQLLEATFFHNKHALVERTKDNYLFLPDTYWNNTDTFVNGIPVKPESIRTVHVREVDKVYTRERKFAEWSAETSPQKRYVLYIQTAPKRARRDSTYYVFSPFYSGDF